MQRSATARRARTREANHEGFDYVLALTVAALVIIGQIMVYSATFDWSLQDTASLVRYASRQFMSAGIGLLVLVAVVFIPYEWLRKAAVPIMGVALALLVLVLIFGEEKFGAKRTLWGFQPSEVAKLGTVIYVAAWLSSKREQVRNVTYGLVPFAVVIGVIAGLIVLQPDVSVAVLIVATALAMFFFAGADLFQLGAGGIIGGAASLVAVKYLRYAEKRLTGFWLIWRDPKLEDVNHHLQQALIALGSGGLFGVGLGQGRQKLGYLPAPHTDSIFAVIGEEMGLVGCLFVLGLFVLLAYRGFKIALSTTDPFAALLACGITCWLIFQATINIGVITGLLPFTGSALPFVSYGGSSLIVSLAGVGLLLSVSRSRRARRAAPKGQRERANLDRGGRDRGARVSRSGRR